MADKKYGIPELTKNQKKAAELMQLAADETLRTRANNKGNTPKWDNSGVRRDKAAQVMQADTAERVAKPAAKNSMKTLRNKSTSEIARLGLKKGGVVKSKGDGCISHGRTKGRMR